MKANRPTEGNETVPRKPPSQHECAIFMQTRPYSYGVPQQSSPGKALAPRSSLPGTHATRKEEGTRGALPAQVSLTDGRVSLEAASQSACSLIPLQHIEMNAQTARTDLFQRHLFSLPNFTLLC